MQEKLPNVHNHKLKWILFSVVVAAAFFLIWTMGFFGTPIHSAVRP